MIAIVIGLSSLVAVLASARWVSFPIILKLTSREARTLASARSRALSLRGSRDRARPRGLSLFSGTFHGQRTKVFENGAYAPFGTYEYKSTAGVGTRLLLAKSPWAHQLVMRYAFVDYDDIVAIGRVDMLWTIMDEFGMRRDKQCAGAQIETSDLRVCLIFGGAELVPFVRAMQAAMGAAWYAAMERGGEVRGVLLSRVMLRGGWTSKAGPVEIRLASSEHDLYHPPDWSRFSITNSTNTAHGDLFKHSMVRLGRPLGSAHPPVPAYTLMPSTGEGNEPQVEWY